MIIETDWTNTTTEDIYNILVDLKDNNVVFHYFCEECEDEQVTSEVYNSDELIEELKENENILYVNLGCTACENNQKFIKFEDIMYIEFGLEEYKEKNYNQLMEIECKHNKNKTKRNESNGK